MARTGRPPKEPDEVLDARVDFRMLPEEKQLFEEAAECAGAKLSAWMRGQLRKAAEKEILKAKKKRSP